MPSMSSALGKSSCMNTATRNKLIILQELEDRKKEKKNKGKEKKKMKMK